MRKAGVVLLCLLGFIAGAAARAETRVALVIGNSSYAHAPVLKNPVNDANLIAARLKSIGFQVLSGTDLDKAGFDALLRKFAGQAQGADAAVFYYAGHGLQVDGENWLVPVDADIRSKADLGISAIDLNTALQVMQARAKVSVVFLDACREDPFRAFDNGGGSRGVVLGRGLAPIASADGQAFIAFAAQPGATAADGDGADSYFSEALGREIVTPGLKITDLMERVNSRVRATTGGAQIPWYNSGLSQSFYLVPESVPAPDVRPALQNNPPQPPAAQINETVAAIPSTPVLSPRAVRVGVILPFSSATPAVRALADAMLKSAQLARDESGNKDIVLMTADEGATPAEAGAAARKLLEQGAEIIIGPIHAASVTAVAAEARRSGVPVLAFSTDRSVAGNGVYLMSFLPQNETDRVVAYALAHGHRNFAALAPNTPYGDVTLATLRADVLAANANLVDVERFATAADAATAAALARTDADALFLPQGGANLRAISQKLRAAGLDAAKVKLMGTGLWDDATLLNEPALAGAWFAAPEPGGDTPFVAKYKAAFGAAPPALAGLSYDATGLVALLANGQPFKRFTRAALTDPNGYAGVTGMFRFDVDGTPERGLAILAVTPNGFQVIDHAPTTFVKTGS